MVIFPQKVLENDNLILEKWSIQIFCCFLCFLTLNYHELISSQWKNKTKEVKKKSYIHLLVSSDLYCDTPGMTLKMSLKIGKMSLNMLKKLIFFLETCCHHGQNFTDDKPTLFEVMAWCHQATGHYLNRCWPSSILPCGVTRPQWVKQLDLSRCNDDYSS